jgi:adenylylsulfate kinase
MTGLSGAGKSTLADGVCLELRRLGYAVEVIDGDVYRKTLCRDLGFSRADRIENIRRLSEVGWELAKKGVIVLIAAINPYEEGRMAVRQLAAERARSAGLVKTVWVDCALEVLAARDTKGLYRRAYLPEGHPDRVNNLTGVNDPFEEPVAYDLRIDTAEGDIESCTQQLVELIVRSVRLAGDDPF